MSTAEEVELAALKLRADSGGALTEEEVRKKLAIQYEDVSPDDIAAGVRAAFKPLEVDLDPERPITVYDFYAFMPSHRYLYVPTRNLWPASSVNARLPPVMKLDRKGQPVIDAKTKAPAMISPSTWLDRHRPVEQMTWAPGEPSVIHDRIIDEGGWIAHKGVRVFNHYRPPRIQLGDPAEAGPWLTHLHRIYEADSFHITRWFAHRVQRPGEKINHALVLGGPQGIGKDSLIEPVKRAVGPWNCFEVSPLVLLGRFNEHLQSVILRVSEARDLGETNRFALYEHMKTITAAPPDVLRIDRKHMQEYAIPNVCGVIVTTNHRTDALYLPADDRRHYVAWSECTKEEFSPEYWDTLWSWYDDGGDRHVAAYLHNFDLSDFNPKAAPGRTEAFHAIAAASRAPEESELAEVIDKLGNPPAITLTQLADAADPDLRRWLTDRANRRQLPHRLEGAGYVSVRNPGPTDGHWPLPGTRGCIYVRQEIPAPGRLKAAKQWIEDHRHKGAASR